MLCFDLIPFSIIFSLLSQCQASAVWGFGEYTLEHWNDGRRVGFFELNADECMVGMFLYLVVVGGSG